jgi:3-deoxy-D-manno-octulosonate 8-phosphate phosphatase (KDO 8-P phosphatase)
MDLSLETQIRNVRLIAFDFDGVFTDNSVYVFESGAEAVRCCRSDGFGLQKLNRLGVETIVISTETNPVVSARCKKLNIKCEQGCENKSLALDSIIKEIGITLKQVAFVGNDINDLPCLKKVGLPIIVQDAHLDIIPYAHYQTKANGGHGAVREICDLFERTLSPNER